MSKEADRNGELIYSERLSSRRTQALFLALAGLFGLLALWRWRAQGLGFWTGVLLVFFLFFAFSWLNYRMLVIRITPQSLRLQFGLITWREPLENIADCRLDELSKLMYYGGAGVHFFFNQGRYRVSFNFLEYPRLVLALREKRGWVREVSFSTRRPEEARRWIQARSKSDPKGLENL